MKKLFTFIVLALFSFMATAQVSKTVNVPLAGMLSTLLTPTELSTVTNLTVTGSIDARDVKTMRDNMPLLAVLDIGAVSIQTYTGSDGTYNGGTTYPANEMPQQSFYYGNYSGKNTLKTITLPASITSIGDFAFYLCSGFTGSLVLPNSVTTIGDYAFRGCSGFTGSLILPNSVTTIGDWAFYFCIGFTGSLILPNSVTTIGNYAFQYCSGFTGSLTLPNSVTTIGDRAFYGCNGFRGSLTLGSGLISIADGAFYDCYFKIINSLNTIPPTIGGGNFYQVSMVYVPASAGAAYKATAGWSGFTIAAEKHVTINVPTAGGMAAAIINGGFSPLNSITHLTVTGNLNSIDINQMKTNMTALTAIDLTGATLASNALPANAFQGRTSLTSVLLPATLLIIGESAFDGCINLLGNIPLPATVTSIGASAFQNCPSLTGTLTILVGVTVINNSTFAGCSGITGNLIIPDNVTSIGSYAFQGCKGLTGNLIIPNTLNSLGDGAFSACYGFSGTLTLPNTLNSLGDGAFSACSGFSGTLTLPNTLNSLGDGAFSYCSGFTGTLTLPNTLTTVSNFAFAFCSQLSGKVEVPLSVTSIGNSAFQDCAKITELSVGKNLTGIGDNALNGCTSLAKISVPRTTPPTVYANTFTGIPVESCIVNVPTGASITYQIANYWSMFSHYTETLSSDNYTVTSYSNVKVYTNSSDIIIEGSSAGETISLFNINGKQITSQKSQGERMVIPAQKDAVYLVKTAGRTFKVLL